MPELQKCPQCGTDVPANAPFGHCPKCLLDLGIGQTGGDTVPTSSAAVGPGSERAFGDYELMDQIGRGGMGVVYKARQVRLNRLVALKMISAGEFASSTLVQRFQREAEAAANLHHPNIVPIYETGELKGQYFYSMQLIEGTGLDRSISRSGFQSQAWPKDGRLTTRTMQEQIARIIAKVARAVDHAHQRGVLHRDLKPSNIIIDQQGEPHLTDFGVAKVLAHEASSLTASGAIMGTPSYMAPEQASGQSKRITIAADVYSLGAILYVMLTGTPPFRGGTPVETLRQVIEQDPKHPSTLRDGIDVNLATIAMKCLEKEPQRRYSSALTLAEDLERWLRHEPIVALPVAPAERAWRWCQRNPKAAAFAGFFVLLLIAVTVGSLLVALHIQHLKEAAENNSLRLRNEVLDSLDKLYSDTNTFSYTIKAEVRHALAGRTPSPDLPSPPLELTFVDYVYGHPTNILEIFDPILEVLERDLSKRLAQPVLIHLRMLSSYDLGYDALEKDPLAFGRVGPSSFIQRLDRNSGMRLVAMQDQTKPLTLALFTRAGSHLAQAAAAQPRPSLAVLLANRSFAFGNPMSTTGNFAPRCYLATNGVFATNLARFQNLRSPAAVIDAVRAGQFDVGALNQEMLRKFPDLVVIDSYQIADLGRCWVAGPDLPHKTFMAIRASLLSMSDKAIIGKLESELDGFVVIDKRALEWLRVIMSGADSFEGSK